MKEYKCGYNDYTAIDIIGEQFTVSYGGRISTTDGELFTYNKHLFTIPREKLKRYFVRIYTTEDLDRYDRIRERAMIAAMQSMVANLKDVEVSEDMHELRNIPRNAIWLADRLVKEYKERDY